MSFATINNINLYYEVNGKGQPLVLISGTGGDHFFWDVHLDVFAKHFQVITFDNRGVGQTDIPDEPYSIEQMADDIAGLLEHLNLNKSHILGFSMGGAIAQSFALRHPEKVDKLIIAGSFAKMNTQTRLFLDAVLAAYETGITEKQFYELILPWLFSAYFLENEDNVAQMQFNPNDPYPQPKHGFKWQYLAQRKFNVLRACHQLRFLAANSTNLRNF